MRPRRRRVQSILSQTKTMSPSDWYSQAYYLYTISKNTRENPFDLDMFMDVKSIAQQLGRDEELSLALEGCVKDLEERGYLSLVKVAYTEMYPELKYEIDKEIFDKKTLAMTSVKLNLSRLCIAEQDNTQLSGLFAKLVYLVFFTAKSKISQLSRLSIEEVLSLKINKKYLQKINDLSDVDFLRNTVGLSENELRVIQLLYRLEYSSSHYIWECSGLSFEEFVQSILNLSSNEYAMITRKDQKLRSYGFLDRENDLSGAFVEVLKHQNLNLYFLDLIKEIDVQDAYALNSFAVAESKTELMYQMLKGEKPVSLLLYGKPGSGKTEYAKALARETGKKVIIFKSGVELNEGHHSLFKLNFLLSLNKQDSILIVDEAESILSGVEFTYFGSVAGKKKGLVNRMLDNNKNKVIWIVNYTDRIDESTKRRFTMSCQFNAMPKETLDRILISKLESLCISESLQKNIMGKFGKYNITGSSVDNVVKSLLSFTGASDEVLLENTEIILKENSLLINGKSQLRETVATSYDSSVLNTSMDAQSIVRMVQNARRFAEKNRMEHETDAAVRMLFYGVSGTGKTEFARYLSQQLGKQILLKRVSDIMSKYVGETEANIANAFAEATEKDMILLFDEADSFFADRNGAVRSWERTQVNEFLTQMEEFPGILICTTNLKHILDKASLRRFHITVEFKPMEEEGIKNLLKKFFPAYFSKSTETDYQKKLEHMNLSQLLRYNSVTPGDFNRVAGKIRFMDEEEISDQMIIDELCFIQEEKAGSNCSHIGFAV